jgi:hypothetical protein
MERAPDALLPDPKIKPKVAPMLFNVHVFGMFTIVEQAVFVNAFSSSALSSVQ